MPITIPIAHDFTCPWCWAGLFHALWLKKEFGVSLEWIGYELYPVELEWPEPTPKVDPPANRPPTLSRLQFLLLMDGIEVPKVERPKQMRIHNAHEAVEAVKAAGGDVDGFVECLYRAYWERGEEINAPEVLGNLAEPFGLHPVELQKVISERRFADKIIGFDDPAYAVGVYNVPTFFIGEDRLAEQPYTVLKSSLERRLRLENGLYAHLEFPPAPADRPFVMVNMVTTIDGKILSGDRENGEVELGSRVDREMMRRIERHADAIILGATTLRHTSTKWVPGTAHRIVVSRSGEFDASHGFFSGGKAWMATSEEHAEKAPAGIEPLVGEDLPAILKRLREMGVERLLLLGGSELNAQFFMDDLVDEVFWTVAPMVKLGKHIPTYADGTPITGALPRFELISKESVGDELFLRYRRSRT